MRSLNLDQLRALVAVVEGKSFSAAARRLHLSQPAVSLQIRELERRFGVQLVERLGKQAHATPPGRELIAAAQRIFHECDSAEAALRRYRDGWIGRVRIGTTLTALMYLLPPVLRRLSLEHPGIDLHVANMPTRESVGGIIQNQLDLAIVTLPVDTAQLSVTPITTEAMVAIFSDGAKDIPDVVTPEFVMRQPLVLEQTRAAVHELVMNWLVAAPGKPRIAMHLGTIEALKRAAAGNLGMTIVPEMAVGPHEDDIVVRPLRPALTRTLALIEHKNKPNERALEIVREALLGLMDPSGHSPSAAKGRRRA